MENRSHALMAGFFTLAFLALATMFAIWLGRDKIQRDTYEIATRTSVAGLNLQAAVRYKGIKVGSVTRIDFDPKVPGQIVLRIEIATETPVTTSTFATLGYQGMTGIAYVQLDDEGQSSQTLAAAGQDDNALPRIPLKPGLMQNLEQRGLAILTQTEELTRRLNAMLDPGNRQSLMAAVAHFDQAATAWQAVPGKLEPTLTQLPALAEQTRNTMTEVSKFSADAARLSNNLNQFSTALQAPDGALARFNRAVEQIGNGVTLETLPQLHSLSGEARSSLRALKRTTENLSERPQSILFGNALPAPGPGEPGFVAPR